MKCKQCGEENLEGASFCKKCGKNFIEENKTDSSTTENNKTNLESETNNSLSVYCRCGQKLESNWKFCSNCKEPITVEIKEANREEQNINDKYAGIYIAIFIISTASGYLFNFGLGHLIALITIVTAKITCPHSIVIKVLFWLTILRLVLFIVFMIWFIVACNGALISCGEILTT